MSNVREARSNFDLICANSTMLAILLIEHEKFGTTFVIEDGLIVEKHYNNKIVKGDKDDIRRSRNCIVM